MNSLSSYISSHQDTQPDLFAFFTATILEKIHHHFPTAIHELSNFSENLDDDLQMKQGELYTRTIKIILFTTPRSSKPRLLQSEHHLIGEWWINRLQTSLLRLVLGHRCLDQLPKAHSQGSETDLIDLSTF
ncbi:hypothetical protein BLNAU_14430 [Blattamonas nauphoetae]|uniref:Uncharacterized protein n=1 Tax=Blattamonas nauphoetae TaxID=2049346 RepID=A0ABQ9XGT6_9EUKA|nr:hypothetical protein BLNAU_14430 [Blattamonas nauphoetae]